MNEALFSARAAAAPHGRPSWRSRRLPEPGAAGRGPKFLPPLNVSADLLKEALQILEQGVDTVLALV